MFLFHEKHPTLHGCYWLALWYSPVGYFIPSSQPPKPSVTSDSPHALTICPHSRAECPPLHSNWHPPRWSQRPLSSWIQPQVCPHHPRRPAPPPLPTPLSLRTCKMFAFNDESQQGGQAGYTVVGANLPSNCLQVLTGDKEQHKSGTGVGKLRKLYRTSWLRKPLVSLALLYHAFLMKFSSLFLPLSERRHFLPPPAWWPIARFTFGCFGRPLPSSLLRTFNCPPTKSLGPYSLDPRCFGFLYGRKMLQVSDRCGSFWAGYWPWFGVTGLTGLTSKGGVNGYEPGWCQFDQTGDLGKFSAWLQSGMLVCDVWLHMWRFWMKTTIYYCLLMFGALMWVGDIWIRYGFGLFQQFGLHSDVDSIDQIVFRVTTCEFEMRNNVFDLFCRLEFIFGEASWLLVEQLLVETFLDSFCFYLSREEVEVKWKAQTCENFGSLCWCGKRSFCNWKGLCNQCGACGFGFVSLCFGLSLCCWKNPIYERKVGDCIFS